MKKLIASVFTVLFFVSTLLADTPVPYGTTVVAKAEYLNQSSNFSWTAIYTVPATADYRVTVLRTGNFTCQPSVDLGYDSYSQDMQTGGQTAVFRVPLGNTVNVMVSSCSGSGNYDLIVTLEKI
jgi:hypothetical protein